MANNKIQIKRSSVAGRAPTAEQLAVGEFAVNLTDNRLFTKDASNTVIDVLGQSLNTTANVSFSQVNSNNVVTSQVDGTGSLVLNQSGAGGFVIVKNNGLESRFTPSGAFEPAGPIAGSSYNSNQVDVTNLGPMQLKGMVYGVQVATSPDNGTTSHVWSFGTDGALSTPGSVTANGDVTVDGNVIANGDVTANGTITANTFVGNVDWSYVTSKPDLKISITGDATGNQTFTDLANGSIDVTLANTTVTAGTYGNSSVIPVITVDSKGRVTSATTNAVAGITGYSYTAANNTFAITAGDGSVYKATIGTVNTFAVSNTLNVTGVGTFSSDVNITGNLSVSGTTTYINTSQLNIGDNIITLNANTTGSPALNAGIEIARGTSANVSILWNEADDRWTFTEDGTNYVRFIGNTEFDAAILSVTEIAANGAGADAAYANAVATASTDATNKAANAYSNAVSTAATDATNKAANAYSNAVSTAATDATNKAANAYSNAVSYTDTAVGTAYSNAVTVATNLAANAYSNAVSYADTAAATAYSNATSYADTQASAAYTNAVSTAATDATDKAANAYSNAVSFATTAAGDAYSNAISYVDTSVGTAYSNATTYADVAANAAYSNAISFATTAANNAYSNAVSVAASYTDSKAANAYSNAISYADTAAATAAGTAYANAIAYADVAANTAYANARSWASYLYSAGAAYSDAKAANAYSNAVSFATTAANNAYSNAVSFATTAADTAYSNAVTFATTAANNAYVNAVSFATTIANTAYSNAVSVSASDASSKAAVAYTNAISYADVVATTAYNNAVTFATDKAANAYANAVAYTNTQLAGKANSASPTFAGAITLGGIATFTGNVEFSSNTRISTNGSVGSAGQVLTSGGPSGNLYWSTVTSGGANLTLSSAAGGVHYFPMSTTTTGAWANGEVDSALKYNPTSKALSIDEGLITLTQTGTGNTLIYGNKILLGFGSSNWANIAGEQSAHYSTTSTATVNASGIYIGNASFYATVNSTAFALNGVPIGGGSGATYTISTPANTSSANVKILGSDASNSSVKMVGTGGVNISSDGTTITVDGGSVTGGGGNAFGTIAVSGQSSVVAEQSNDTLTFVAGSNMTITTNPSGDTITFSSTGGGGGSTGNNAGNAFISGRDNFVGNGTTTTFTLSQTSSANSILVLVEGLVQFHSEDYSVSGTTLTFGSAPANNEAIEVLHISGASTYHFMQYGAIDTFTGNGSTSDYTLSVSANTSTATVYLDGLLQAPTTDFTISGTTLSFTSAPLDGDVVLVYHTESVSSAIQGIAIFGTDAFTGDGSNTQFTVSSTADVNSSLVTVNGIVQRYGVDYSITGLTLSFADAPPSGSAVQAMRFSGSVGTAYRSVAVGSTTITAPATDSTLTFANTAGVTLSASSTTVTVGLTDIAKQSLTGNGSNTDFTLSYSTTADDIFVYVNGIYFHPDEDYTVANTTITFTTAPVDTSQIRIRFMRAPSGVISSEGDMMSLDGAEDLMSASGVEDLMDGDIDLSSSVGSEDLSTATGSEDLMA